MVLFADRELSGVILLMKVWFHLTDAQPRMRRSRTLGPTRPVTVLAPSDDLFCGAGRVGPPTI